MKLAYVCFSQTNFNGVAKLMSPRDFDYCAMAKKGPAHCVLSSSKVGIEPCSDAQATGGPATSQRHNSQTGPMDDPGGGWGGRRGVRWDLSGLLFVHREQGSAADVSPPPQQYPCGTKKIRVKK